MTNINQVAADMGVSTAKVSTPLTCKARDFAHMRVRSIWAAAN